MVDITITATSVVAASNVTRDSGTAGEAITAGQAVYRSSTTNKWMLADSNSATAEARKATGIALNGAALNQPVTVAKNGDITLGAVLTAGTAYYLSDTPGGICPVADIGAGEYVCLLGLAKSTSVLALGIQFPGVSL
ncbi:hypothetical protein EET67_05170 [Pseudaminobacter arsenicus]|uniref:DUF2190 family protein n=1 Tax=Borborobacter arsenicus TaxID=1851146 RepID=A0A432VA19_9HYPH|nr:hypothetical protein [Pseudaminobacter arsenicus]RUM99031.1 hypothetical protein EET67_05170 [Pseudaminobacter arsenicus]